MADKKISVILAIGENGLTPTGTRHQPHTVPGDVVPVEDIHRMGIEGEWNLGLRGRRMREQGRDGVGEM